MKHFDVVVIGAGPAGCASAISCARRGLRVALLERHAFPRFRPGESLHPGIEPLLRQLGIADLLGASSTLRFEGQWVHWHGPARFNAFGTDANGPWRGFHISRAQLDRALLQQARPRGSRCISHVGRSRCSPMGAESSVWRPTAAAFLPRI